MHLLTVRARQFVVVCELNDDPLFDGDAHESDVDADHAPPESLVGLLLAQLGQQRRRAAR